MAYSRPGRTTKPFWGVEGLRGADALKLDPENPGALTGLGWAEPAETGPQGLPGCLQGEVLPWHPQEVPAGRGRLGPNPFSGFSGSPHYLNYLEGLSQSYGGFHLGPQLPQAEPGQLLALFGDEKAGRTGEVQATILALST